MKQSPKWLSRVLAGVAIAVIAGILLLRRGNLAWHVEVCLYGLALGLLEPLIRTIPGKALVDRDLGRLGGRIALAAIVCGLVALVLVYVMS